MPLIHGKSGALYANMHQIAQVTNWSYQESVDLAEVTVIGDTHKKYHPGLKEGSGSLACLWDVKDNGQMTLKAGDVVTLHVYPQGKADGLEYTGDVHIESFTVSGDRDSLIKMDLQFKGILALEGVA